MAKLSREEILEVLAPLFALDESAMDFEMPTVWQVPEGYKLDVFTLNGVKVEKLAPMEKKTDLVFLHLHGGGYVIRYMDPYRDIAHGYSNAAGGAEVISIDYGCSPNHLFPSAIEETKVVYSWMLEQGYKPENIVIVGDSAGGNLTLAFTMYIRDNSLPMPKALMCFSPWTSLETSFKTMESNKENDLILGTTNPFLYKQVMNPIYAGDTDVKNPYLSPLHGEYHEFPQMLVQCGGHEMFYDEINEMVEKAKKAGVDVTFQAYPGMSHDFQLFLPMLDESMEAWKNIGEFLSKLK